MESICDDPEIIAENIKVQETPYVTFTIILHCKKKNKKHDTTNNRILSTYSK